jgi:hypothetical protein
LGERLILTHGGLKTQDINGELIVAVTGAAPKNIARTDAGLPEVSKNCLADWAKKIIADINQSQNRNGIHVRQLPGLNRLAAHNDLLIYGLSNACKVVAIPSVHSLLFLHELPSCTDVAFKNLE